MGSSISFRAWGGTQRADLDGKMTVTTSAESNTRLKFPVENKADREYFAESLEQPRSKFKKGDDDTESGLLKSTSQDRKSTGLAFAADYWKHATDELGGRNFGQTSDSRRTLEMALRPPIAASLHDKASLPESGRDMHASLVRNEFSQNEGYLEHRADQMRFASSLPVNLLVGRNLGSRVPWLQSSYLDNPKQQLRPLLGNEREQHTSAVRNPKFESHTKRTRFPIVLYNPSDDSTLSAYQCLVRQQIEIFEATEDDVQFNISKMSKTIVLGQVGIRCRHCAVLPQYSRPKAAVYYPRSLDSLYQFGQNMVKNHLCGTCKLIPEDTRQLLMTLQEERRRGKGGRERWADAAREMGLFEDHHGLRFSCDSTTL